MYLELQRWEFVRKFFQMSKASRAPAAVALALQFFVAFLSWKNFLTNSHSKISAWQHSDAVLCSTRKATCSCFRSGATTPEAKHPSRRLSETHPSRRDPQLLSSIRPFGAPPSSAKKNATDCPPNVCNKFSQILQSCYHAYHNPCKSVRNSPEKIRSA